MKEDAQSEKKELTAVEKQRMVSRYKVLHRWRERWEALSCDRKRMQGRLQTTQEYIDYRAAKANAGIGELIKLCGG